MTPPWRVAPNFPPMKSKRQKILTALFLTPGTLVPCYYLAGVGQMILATRAQPGTVLVAFAWPLLLPFMSPQQRKSHLLGVLLYTVAPFTEGFDWFEQAQQDDGTTVLVHKIEKRSISAKTLDEEHDWGRIHSVELADPVTGRTIRWDPDGWSLRPFALHLHLGVPYLFTLPGDVTYERYGCPSPPYIVFKWDGTAWSRVALDALPVRFHRRNLLATSSERLRHVGWISKGMVVDAAEIVPGYPPAAVHAIHRVRERRSVCRCDGNEQLRWTRKSARKSRGW